MPNRIQSLLVTLLAAASLALGAGCSTKGTYQQAVSDHWSTYGPVLRSDPPTMTVSEMASGEVAGPVVLTGVVRGVCQTKGCWMTVAADGADEPVFVKFRDYGFFVPRNAVGRQVVMNGSPVVTEVSVQMLRHYGRDAGQSEEQVMLITEPERRLEFVADSVLIQGRGLEAPYVASSPSRSKARPFPTSTTSVPRWCQAASRRARRPRPPQAPSSFRMSASTAGVRPLPPLPRTSRPPSQSPPAPPPPLPRATSRSDRPSSTTEPGRLSLAAPIATEFVSPEPDRTPTLSILLRGGRVIDPASS
ncbi:MAG: DUF4920 domain-containing protein, partial [Phycisphaerales bacterium]